MMIPKTILIGDIKIDGGTQPRIAIDENYIDELAEAIAGKTPIPPVIVYDDGSNKWLADGFHRFHAHLKLNETTIKADVRTGTRRDAILYSVGTNNAHGLRRTNADKRRAVTTLFADLEWGQWSDNRIAEMCQVSQPFVSSVRAGMVTAAVATVAIVDGPAKTVELKPSVDEKTDAKDEESIHLDRFEVSIPDNISMIFERNQEIKTLMTDVSALKSKILDAVKSGDALYGRINPQRWQADCENLRRALRFSAPYCVCRMCQGEPNIGGGCKACRDTGWQTESEHNAVITELRGTVPYRFDSKKRGPAGDSSG